MEFLFVLLRPLLGIGLICLLVEIFHRVSARGSRLWNSMPIMGLQGQTWVSWLTATVASLWKTADWTSDGYARHSKANKAFLVPSIERGATVILPPKQIRKVYGLPAESLDSVHTANETLQLQWTVWDTNVWRNNFQINVIRNQLTRNLDILTPMINTELKLGFEKWWGTDTEHWKELSIFESCLKLIAGASNGAFCGPPLCRDDEFLDNLLQHALAVVINGIVLNTTPWILRCFVGPIVAMICRYRFWRVRSRAEAHVRRRLEETAKLKADSSYPWTPPKDGLQWLIDECYAQPNPSSELNPQRVCHRLVLLNDISLYTTAFTCQNFILDLFSSDQADEFIQALRTECETALSKAGGKWTFDAVKQLTLVDAAIRESMRLSPFGSVALPRTVVHPNGITLEGGVTVPPGRKIAVPIEAIHYDDEFYADAKRFDIYRFSRSSAAGREPAAPNPVTTTKTEKVKTAASLDNVFLGFGFGKHACPGRFFAIHEVKIFVANMLLNYDVAHLPQRPQTKVFSWLRFPVEKGKVMVRRREGAWRS